MKSSSYQTSLTYDYDSNLQNKIAEKVTGWLTKNGQDLIFLLYNRFALDDVFHHVYFDKI